MEHRKLSALLSPIQRLAKVAAYGAETSRDSQTEPSGAKSYDNADGTRTIIGNIANGESNPSYTMATHVGDETPPGIPAGITASSKSGVVVVEWDGTLDGGIPDDFFCVRIYLDGAELGVLREAGSVSSAKLEGGTTHSVTATAEDDACLPDGTPAHNVSDATAAVSVTVSEGVESVAAIAQQALEVANATGQYFWHNTGEEADPIEADVSGGTGAHVTQFKREEWSDPTHENYHKGPNSLWNSLGMLFRNGLNNLMALLPSPDQFTPSRIAFYDGEGNADANIMAYIEPDEVQLVRQVSDVAISTGTVSLLGNKVYISGQNDPTTGETTGELTTVNNTLQNWNTFGTTVSKTQEGSSTAYDWANAEQYLRAYIHDGQSAVYSDMGVYASKASAAATNAYIRSPELQLATSANGATGTVVLNADMLEVINSIRTASTTINLSNVGSGTHTLNLYRQGHFVFASMANAINPTSANTAINAGTVPSGYRPAVWAMCSGAGMVGNTINNWFYRWRVATTGAITLHISVTGAREAPLVMTWFTNDDWPS